MNPTTTLTNNNPPAAPGCGLNPNPICREESETPHAGTSTDQPHVEADYLTRGVALDMPVAVELPARTHAT
jgi:hypothetical protein